MRTESGVPVTHAGKWPSHCVAMAGRGQCGVVWAVGCRVLNERTVDSINTVVRFCARRDVPALTREALRSAPADVAILFGGTIVAGADVFAAAMREQVASRYMIVGGQGHTTGTLRRSLREQMGWDDVESGTEAALLDRYLRERHNPSAQLINYASHQATVALATDGQLTCPAPPEGMWPAGRYVA